MVIKRILEHQISLTTTAINIEEQLRGRLAQVAQARDGFKQSNAYQRLAETVMLLSEFSFIGEKPHT